MSIQYYKCFRPRPSRQPCHFCAVCTMTGWELGSSEKLLADAAKTFKTISSEMNRMKLTASFASCETWSPSAASDRSSCEAATGWATGWAPGWAPGWACCISTSECTRAGWSDRAGHQVEWSRLVLADKLNCHVKLLPWQNPNDAVARAPRPPRFAGTLRSVTSLLERSRCAFRCSVVRTKSPEFFPLTQMRWEFLDQITNCLDGAHWMKTVVPSIRDISLLGSARFVPPSSYRTDSLRFTDELHSVSCSCSLIIIADKPWAITVQTRRLEVLHMLPYVLNDSNTLSLWIVTTTVKECPIRKTMAMTKLNSELPF